MIDRIDGINKKEEVFRTGSEPGRTSFQSFREGSCSAEMRTSTIDVTSLPI
jgi:hypothetical protein